MKPWNQAGKFPSWRIRGAWVSVNHLRASSLSLLSVLSSWQSFAGRLCSILTRFWTQPKRRGSNTGTELSLPSALHFAPEWIHSVALICLFSTWRHKMPWPSQHSHCSCLSCPGWSKQRGYILLSPPILPSRGVKECGPMEI